MVIQHNYLTTVHPFAVAIAGVHPADPAHRLTFIVFPETVGKAVSIQIGRAHV